VAAAIWATLKGAGAHRDRLSIHAKLAEIEEARERDRLADKKKVHLETTVTRNLTRPDVWAYTLVIRNAGPGTARDVTVLPKAGHLFSKSASTRVDVLDPGASHSVSLSRGMRGSHPPLTIGVTWTNESGEEERLTTALAL